MLQGLSHETFSLFARYQALLLDTSSSTDVSRQIIDESKQCLADIQTQLAINKALQDLHYTQLGQNRESAMDWNEISRTLYLFQKLKTHYAAQFVAKKGTDGILNDFVTYLAKACKDPTCATDPSKRQYNPSDSKKIRMRKTALRALLDDAPNTKFGSCLHPGAKEVYGNGALFSARELLAYFILAASDPHMPLPEKLEEVREQCVNEEILNVVANLADIRRGHNNDGDFRGKDDPIDEPTCFPGLIGRIGNMHLHNQITALEEFTTPSDHFKRKMQAFIIGQFTKVPPEIEFSIVNATFYRIHNSEKDPNNTDADRFAEQLLTKENLAAFIEQLTNEFGPLDSHHLKMATLTYVHEVHDFKYQIEQNLLTRLESIANENIVHVVRKSAEAALEKEGVTEGAVKQLGLIMKQIALLAENIRILSKSKLPTLEDIASIEVQWQQLKSEHDRLIQQQSRIAQEITQAVETRITTSLQKYEKIYETNRGTKTQILQGNYRKNSVFYPFWFSKAKLKFEDLDIDCQQSALAFSDMLRKERERLLLDKFAIVLPNADLIKNGEVKKLKRLLALQIERHICALNLFDDSHKETIAELKNTRLAVLSTIQAIVSSMNLPFSAANMQFLVNILCAKQDTLIAAGIDEKTAKLFGKLSRLMNEADVYIEQHDGPRHSTLKAKRVTLHSLNHHKITASTLLSPFEIQKAQHYIMAHAENPEILRLQPHLKPGIFVKIDASPADPVTVTFVDPFNGMTETTTQIPLYLLKEYADYDKKLRKSLAHEVDVLLRGFCELDAIDPKDRRAFQDLFLKQLCWHKDHNPGFFQAVLLRQESKDLLALLGMLDLFSDDHPFVALAEPIMSARSKRQQDYLHLHPNQSQDEWEHLQVALAQCALEDDVQRVYSFTK